MKTDRLNQRIDPEQMRRLRAESKRTGLSQSAIVTLALNSYFSRPETDRDSKRPAGQKGH